MPGNNPFHDTDPQMQDYYENYWGRPVHDEDRLFEYLTLESFQAGLSWKTVWLKHRAFERDFAYFQIDKVAAFDETDLSRMINDPGIIRHRGKIQAAIDQARILQKWHQEGQTLVDFCWSFVNGEPKQLSYPADGPLPVTDPAADQLSAALKKAGFKYCGPKIIFSFMCAVGMIQLKAA